MSEREHAGDSPKLLIVQCRLFSMTPWLNRAAAAASSSSSSAFAPSAIVRPKAEYRKNEIGDVVSSRSAAQAAQPDRAGRREAEPSAARRIPTRIGRGRAEQTAEASELGQYPVGQMNVPRSENGRETLSGRQRSSARFWPMPSERNDT